jgi:hypothetical protein
MRRVELYGLQWGMVDPDRHDRRPIALPVSVVEMLRGRRVRQGEMCLALVWAASGAANSYAAMKTARQCPLTA